MHTPHPTRAQEPVDSPQPPSPYGGGPPVVKRWPLALATSVCLMVTVGALFVREFMYTYHPDVAPYRDVGFLASPDWSAHARMINGAFCVVYAILCIGALLLHPFRTVVVRRFVTLFAAAQVVQVIQCVTTRFPDPNVTLRRQQEREHGHALFSMYPIVYLLGAQTAHFYLFAPRFRGLICWSITLVSLLGCWLVLPTQFMYSIDLATAVFSSMSTFLIYHWWVRSPVSIRKRWWVRTFESDALAAFHRLGPREAWRLQFYSSAEPKKDAGGASSGAVLSGDRLLPGDDHGGVAPSTVLYAYSDIEDITDAWRRAGKERRLTGFLSQSPTSTLASPQSQQRTAQRPRVTSDVHQPLVFPGPDTLDQQRSTATQQRASTYGTDVTPGLYGAVNRRDSTTSGAVSQSDGGEAADALKTPDVTPIMPPADRATDNSVNVPPVSPIPDRAGPASVDVSLAQDIAAVEAAAAGVNNSSLPGPFFHPSLTSAAHDDAPVGVVVGGMLANDSHVHRPFRAPSFLNDDEMRRTCYSAQLALMQYVREHFSPRRRFWHPIVVAFVTCGFGAGAGLSQLVAARITNVNRPVHIPLPADVLYGWMPHVLDTTPDWMLYVFVGAVALFMLWHPMRYTLFRRVALVYGFIMALRFGTVLLTFPPDPSPLCAQRAHPGAATCGDLDYSGHTVGFVLAGIVLHVHTPWPWLRVPAWIYVAVGLFMVVASRLHYTRDVMTALLVTYTFWHLFWVALYARPDVLLRSATARLFEVDQYITLVKVADDIRKLRAAERDGDGGGGLAYGAVADDSDGQVARGEPRVSHNVAASPGWNPE